MSPITDGARRIDPLAALVAAGAVVEGLRKIFGVEAEVQVGGEAAHAQFSHRSQGGPGFALHRVRILASVRVETAELDRAVVLAPRQGSFRYGTKPSTHEAGPGEMALIPPGTAGWLTVEDLDARVLVLDRELFQEQSLEAGGPDPVADELPGTLCPRAAAFFLRTLDYVETSLLDNTEAAGSPLLMSSAARMLATAAAHAAAEPAGPDSGAGLVRPAVVRRAIELMEACPDRVSLLEVAQEACVTPRALQSAFRRHLGLTPNAFLRKVRLERAHAELCDPLSQGSVTEISMRWGFGHPGRFSAYYQAEFGESPSRTLARHRCD